MYRQWISRRRTRYTRWYTTRIKGARVMVTVVLDSLAAGLDTPEIIRHYPTLTVDGVRAAVAYGAWLAKQEIRPLTPST